MKNMKLFVWSGDDVPGSGIAFALAERLEDAKEEVTISITGSSSPSEFSEWDLDFLRNSPDVYAQAMAGMTA